jgi:hypothetical protein
MFGCSGSGAMYPDSPPPTSYIQSPGLSVFAPLKFSHSLDGRQRVELSCCAPHTWYGKSAVVAT